MYKFIYFKFINLYLNGVCDSFKKKKNYINEMPHYFPKYSALRVIQSLRIFTRRMKCFMKVVICPNCCNFSFCYFFTCLYKQLIICIQMYIQKLKLKPHLTRTNRLVFSFYTFMSVVVFVLY